MDFRMLMGFLWCALVTSFTSAQTTIPEGHVSGIWESTGSPYLIDGQITVHADSSLNIGPGVDVIFQDYYKLIVNGYLDAIGSEGDSIRFTAADTTEGWHSIRFIDAPDSSHLSYCIIQYGNATGSQSDAKGGGVYCENSNPVISHSSIRNNSSTGWYAGGAGIYLTNSSPLIRYSSINRNTTSAGGGGIQFENNCDPIISYCIINENIAHYGGGISFWNGCDPIISYCSILGNSTSTAAGGGIGCSGDCSPIIEYSVIGWNITQQGGGGGLSIGGSGANLTMSGCIINNNVAAESGGGIRIVNSAVFNVSRCVIHDNTANGVYGGGIDVDLNSNGSLEHCTIVGNNHPYPWGGGAGISIGASTAALVNNIVANNNGGAGIHFEVSGSTTVTYSDFYYNAEGNFSGTSIPASLGPLITTNFNGDSCDVFHNIYLNPSFVDQWGGDFHLTEDSPCIDAGDPSYPFDPDSTIADIGAFYFDSTYVTPESNIELSTNLLDFGIVPIGYQESMPLTIYNIGEGTLVLYYLSTSDPCFSTDFNPADSILVPGDSLLVSVYFSPLEAIFYDEILTIENNDEPVLVVLQGTGEAPLLVGVTLTPYNPPIVIPQSGGSFDFNIMVENFSSTAQTFDLWTDIRLPEVGVVPIITLLDYSLPAFTSVDRDRTQEVPDFAPAGTYTYYAYVGTYPWSVDHYDTFTFEKTGGDQFTYPGGLGSPSDWICTGEEFQEVIFESEPPSEYTFNHPYPNPFNPATALSYQLPVASLVNLSIYDISGRLVTELVNGWRDAGLHEVTFDGSGLVSGIYVYRLEASDSGNPTYLTGKMVLMK
ncbi:hypothetical protein CEE37_05990 [candidate division LCP-89 bacterium B3_LCP]|uniref:Secretion system C-terminal sorting domain-containing protein n=1 Tax=candidate division LCP-89 bacterium B3_LCP TaxID=2012998 RepID=A0A532V203_UNCL8|nr:MAG: hypothetical protein CEE37_05990 [candidate division LCP-89 bacterium B3_LCP]